MFHIHSSIMNLNVKFIHKIYFSHKFNEFKSYQQLNLIKEILNENCFKNFIVKVVMLDDNAQEFNIIFLKIMILLFTGL